MHSDSTTINAPKKNGMFSVASPLLRLDNREDPSTHLHLLYRNSSSTAFKHWALLWVSHLQCFSVKPFCLTGKVMLQKMKRKIPSGLWRAAPAAPQELLLRSFLHRDFYRTCVPDELHELRKLQHTSEFRLKLLMWKHHWTTPERELQSRRKLSPSRSCPHCARVCTSRNPAHPTLAFYNLSWTMTEKRPHKQRDFCSHSGNWVWKSWPGVLSQLFVSECLSC